MIQCSDHAVRLVARRPFCNTVLLSLVAGSLGVAPPSITDQQPMPAVDITRSVLEATARNAKQVLARGQAIADEHVAVANIGAYNVAVAYVARSAATLGNSSALSHDKITEIYYVVSGHGTQVTGRLVGGRRIETSMIGPGWSSRESIANGRATVLGPGEMQIIPPGTGHAWTEIAAGGIVYMVFRLDPEHVIAPLK